MKRLKNELPPVPDIKRIKPFLVNGEDLRITPIVVDWTGFGKNRNKVFFYEASEFEPKIPWMATIDRCDKSNVLYGFIQILVAIWRYMKLVFNNHGCTEGLLNWFYKTSVPFCAIEVCPMYIHMNGNPCCEFKGTGTRDFSFDYAEWNNEAILRMIKNNNPCISSVYGMKKINAWIKKMQKKYPTAQIEFIQELDT